MRIAPASRALSLLCVFAFALTACDSAGPDDDVVMSASAVAVPAASGPTISNGRLVFASQAAFDDYYAKTNGQPVDAVVAQWSQQGFTSMLAREQSDAAAVEAGQRPPDEVRFSVTEDPLLGALLSPGGVIQIGSSLYKVTEQTVYTGTSANASAFESAAVPSGAPSYAVERQGDTAPSSMRADAASETTDSFGGGPTGFKCSSKFTGPTTGAKYRVCGVSFIVGYKFLSGAGAATMGFRMYSFVPVPTRSNQLSMTSTYRLALDGSPLPTNATTVSSSANNSWILARIYMVAVGNRRVYGSITTVHRMTHAGGSGTVTTTASRSNGGSAA